MVVVCFEDTHVTHLAALAGAVVYCGRHGSSESDCRWPMALMAFVVKVFVGEQCEKMAHDHNQLCCNRGSTVKTEPRLAKRHQTQYRITK